jgi:hypothetical protein
MQSPPLPLAQLIKTYTESPVFQVSEEDRQELLKINKSQTMIDGACFGWVMSAAMIDLYFNAKKFVHFKGLNRTVAKLPHLGFHFANIVATFMANQQCAYSSTESAVNILSKYDPGVSILKYRGHILQFHDI